MKTWMLLAAVALAPMGASAQLMVEGSSLIPANENSRTELIKDIEASRAAFLPQAEPLPQVTVRFQPRLDDIKAAIVAAKTPAELIKGQKDLADWKNVVTRDMSSASQRPAEGAIAAQRFVGETAAAREAAWNSGASWGQLFENQSRLAGVSPVPGASAVLAEAPTGAARYKKLRDIAVRSWGADAKIVDAAIKEAMKQNVDPALVLSVIWQESRFNPRATSSCGARGLMQVMPDTGRGMGYSADSLYTVKGSLEAGIKYLKYAANYLKLNVDLSDISEAPVHKMKALLASYNAGIGAVSKWLRQQGADLVRIPYAETRHYVKVIGGKLASLGEALGW